MEPLLILVLLPMVIGAASWVVFRDTTRASCAATAGSMLGIYLCLKALDPDGTWSWLAALLVSPLPIALALATVHFCHGRPQIRNGDNRNGA
jgi:hypothetical protein